jgi:hypothetical protein
MEILNQLKDNINKYGRELEISLFEYYFSDGKVDDVVYALKKFQNEDGGFGHGLEPDFLNPNSSPIQTWTAITILRKLNLDSHHEMITKMLDYLAFSYDKTIKRWPNTIPTNDDYPHAPWWSYRMDHSFNPSISIASFIITHADQNHPVYSYAKEVIYEGILYLELADTKIEPHELRCFVDMANDLTILGGASIISDRINTILLSQMIDAISPDVNSWFNSYAVKPSSLIKSYPSYGAEAFKNLLISELNLALQARDLEGAWDITWDWNSYPKDYAKSKKIWRAIICLEYLFLMKDLNMLKE